MINNNHQVTCGLKLIYIHIYIYTIIYIFKTQLKLISTNIKSKLQLMSAITTLIALIFIAYHTLLPNPADPFVSWVLLLRLSCPKTAKRSSGLAQQILRDQGSWVVCEDWSTNVINQCQPMSTDIWCISVVTEVNLNQCQAFKWRQMEQQNPLHLTDTSD